MTKPDPRRYGAPAGDQSLCGKRVLIVDDNQDLCKSISMFLESRGIEAHPVTTPAQAKECFAEGGYDLIILDIMMNGTDGFDLFRYLRGSVGDEETPVLFVSALVEPHHCNILNNDEAGNARVMSKSDISARLFEEVAYLLR